MSRIASHERDSQQGGRSHTTVKPRKSVQRLAERLRRHGRPGRFALALPDRYPCQPRPQPGSDPVLRRRLSLPASTVSIALATAALAASGLVVASSPAQAANWTQVKKTCVINDARIKENSGMSRSTYRRKVMFVHNDSGGGPQFFAIGSRCRTKAVFDVPGAPARDWEDMAVGPNHTLWFGDIGGNSPRQTVNIVKVKEPRNLVSRELGHKSYPLTYPDGAHNAETLLVRPGSGRVFVVTKSPDGGAIYRAPKSLKPHGPNRMKRIAAAPIGLTGGDFLRDGSRIAIRGYTKLYLYRDIKDSEPRVTRLPKEAQRGGEAIAFRRGGALVLGCEGVGRWLWKARR